MKKKIKEKARKKQKGIDPLTGKKLPKETSLFDTDRKVPKAKGGIYTEDNTRVVDPVAHQERHGNLVKRSRDLEELKMATDGREQVLKHRNGVSNRLLACKRRTDKLDQGTIDWLESQLVAADAELGLVTKNLSKLVTDIAKDSTFVSSALGVNGIGPITIAYCLAYIDLFKARYVSSVWEYAGLGRPSHKRYPEKGTSGGGNKRLRTQLYIMADSNMKTRGAYRDVYDRIKTRLSSSKKITESRTTQGILKEMPWKDTKPGHRHGAALRQIMKHFLADYWFVGRKFMDLPTENGNGLYVDVKLGHKGIIQPEERGWKLPKPVPSRRRR